MKNGLLLLLISFLLVACKKDNEDDAPPVIDFTHTSGYSTGLPVTISFVSSASGVDLVEWDFGDSTTGQGFSTQHTYTAFGNYKVKATAIKGSQSAAIIHDVPVTFFRRVAVKSVEVLQVPTFKAGGVDWDPGTLPDLTCKITFPGDTVYQASAVFNNSETGLFNLIPPQDTYIFDQNVRFDIFDVDTGNVPDRELMGTAYYKFCNVLPTSTTYTDSVQFSSGALRLKVKFEFQQ